MNLSSTTEPAQAGDVVIVGAGGFARETLDVIRAHNLVNPASAITVIGVVDRAPDDASLALLEKRRVPYLGTDDEWLRKGETGVPYLIAVGDPDLRRSIDRRYADAGLRIHPAIVHPSAGLGTDTDLAPGTIVCAGAQLSTNVRTGRHTHINPNATIGHDAQLGDFVSVNPGAVISGHVTLGAGSFVGAGAVILERRRVGEWSTVGAAACVVGDVEPHSTVKGVPAR
ncbi:acetyltransferase [Diaminobutyricibacter sp. McL0608]|uniref:acetyltransferase n=1 Tax=Leifsonia sp. McL0608 TaxID=3143537 RepID=UPI0031F30087